MLSLAYRLLTPKRTVLISDSMEGAGCPDGEYAIAGERVLLKNGRAVTESGALAGSTLSLWRGVCNLSDMCDIPLAEAIRCATRNPARLIGLDGKLGTLTVGAYADMILIEPTARTLSGVVCRGVRI
jgi:N-acetylglucosamine-6-phosphate deacetylase